MGVVKTASTEGVEMIDGLGAALSGITAQTRRMDALANDAANVNTPGYKPVRASTGTPDFSQQGALQETGQPLDLAIEGDGFFQVTRNGGALGLVRSGAFGVDANGYVTTATGERLYPPLQLPAGTGPSSLAVDPSGVATVNGQQIGQVQIVSVPASTGLIENGDGTLGATPASGAPVPAGGSRVVQGALEMSGTDIASNTVDEIATRTAFTASVGSLHAYDEMLGALIELASREGDE
jgi:flagellar basal-body rod protein FlgG